MRARQTVEADHARVVRHAPASAVELVADDLPRQAVLEVLRVGLGRLNKGLVAPAHDGTSAADELVPHVGHRLGAETHHSRAVLPRPVEVPENAKIAVEVDEVVDRPEDYGIEVEEGGRAFQHARLEQEKLVVPASEVDGTPGFETLFVEAATGVAHSLKKVGRGQQRPQKLAALPGVHILPPPSGEVRWEGSDLDAFVQICRIVGKADETVLSRQVAFHRVEQVVHVP